MKTFCFEIGINGKFIECNKIVNIRANHLQGAIRQLYQNNPAMTRVIRILRG